MIKKKSRLLYISYFMKNSITIIIRVLIIKKEIIALIDKNGINIMITILIRKIKGFLKTKCNSNVRIDEILRIFIKTK